MILHNGWLSTVADPLALNGRRPKAPHRTAARASESVELSESTHRKAYSVSGNGQPTNAHRPCAARKARESEIPANPARHQRKRDDGARKSARTSANATNQPIAWLYACVYVQQHDVMAAGIRKTNQSRSFRIRHVIAAQTSAPTTRPTRMSRPRVTSEQRKYGHVPHPKKKLVFAAGP